MTTSVAPAAKQAFLEDLVSGGHLLPSGEPGLYGRGMLFEQVRTAFDGLVTRTGAVDQAETPRFPPLIPRHVLERVGYLRSFPQLAGAVFSFSGDEAAARDMAERADQNRDWSMHLSMTELVLVPAACYPAYPAVARRGPLPAGGVTLDLGGSYVFRHEPSADPGRLQMFHQRELVRIGATEDVLAWRELWMKRATGIFAQLGIAAAFSVASDAFFGRSGMLLANSQREQRLKFELRAPVASHEPSAVASFNFHQEDFVTAFGIRFNDGRIASSACAGFGLERITLALFLAHGAHIWTWPKDVRDQLWPGGIPPKR